MNPEKDPLIRIAKSVSDRRPVDWGAEREANASLGGKIEKLRVLQAIADVHEIPPEGDPDEVSDNGEPGTEVDSDLGEQVTITPGEQESAESYARLPRWGPLRIREKIGRGGFGEVYRAHDPTLNRDVALKLIRPDKERIGVGTRRFITEARRHARVRHPNVLVIHGADVHDGRPGIWTDLLHGETLEERLAEQGPFSAGETILIGIELCKALSAVHAAKLVHRDVKTSNIMRETRGRIVLMDFSASADASRMGDEVSDGSISGTPLFMAPEVLTGGEAGAATDIYSLGVVLYRLVSGRFPVEATSLSELMERHKAGARTALSDVRADIPQSFVLVVERALMDSPEGRFQTAGQMERALTAAAGLSSREDPKRKERRWWKAGAMAAAALLFIAAAALWPYVFPNDLDVHAELHRLDREDQGSARLLDGGRIQPGDQLYLTIEGSKEMYVYVVNADVAGSAFVLFPLPGLDIQNPLPADVAHRLPGAIDGTEQFWNVSSAGGKEAVMVIASTEPLPDFEEQIRRIPRASTVLGGEIDSEQLAHSLRGVARGIGLVAPKQVPEASGTDTALWKVLAGLAGRAGASSTLWTWQVQLENSE